MIMSIRSIYKVLLLKGSALKVCSCICLTAVRICDVLMLTGVGLGIFGEKRESSLI